MHKPRPGLTRRQLLAASAGVAGTVVAACSTTPAGNGAAAPASFSRADLAQAERLRAAALADGTAWQLLQSLCTQVGARPAGSAADAQAVAWAQAALRRLGLAQVRAEGFAMRAWQRGPASARLLLPAPQDLVMAALGNSVAAPAGGIEADVAWYPNLAALQADTSDRAKNRIVFIDQKMERFRDGRGYGLAVQARAPAAPGKRPNAARWRWASAA